MTVHCSDRDWLLLSRHLAGALSFHQAASLEKRLASEPDLRKAMEQLKRTRMLLTSLPEKEIPHNFTIKAGQTASKQVPRLFPTFRFATVVSSLLLAIVLGLRVLPVNMASGPNLMAEPAALSQEYASDDSIAPLAAPKAAAPVEETLTATPDVMTATGAGVLTAPSTIQETPREETITETENTPEKELIPWNRITWTLVILSLALAALAAYMYFRERV
jgi:hypothetical protein